MFRAIMVTRTKVSNRIILESVETVAFDDSGKCWPTVGAGGIRVVKWGITAQVDSLKLVSSRVGECFAVVLVT
jgi:hypothetical protein